MKPMMKILGRGIFAVLMVSTSAIGQTLDDQRMDRDIEVAENILSTMLRQQFDRQRLFFPLEVTGSYQPGYGVTFRLPADFTTPIKFSFDVPAEDAFIWNGHAPNPPAPSGTYSYSYEFNTDDLDDSLEEMEQAREEIDRHAERIEIDRDGNKQAKKTIILKEKATKDKNNLNTKSTDLDSIRDEYNAKMIEASKNFLADYGDLIGQLGPNEKIVITNQGEQPRRWVGKLVNAPHRTRLSIEVVKSDLTLQRQGKLTRNQLLSKIEVINTEAVEALEPDLELLSSIFNRLYQPDLAKTYFTEDKIYYERLKDYGAVYYMQVFSSNQHDRARFSMPTIGIDDLDQETRDKKVAELYPQFEKELKENILEYGRTVKSIKDNEVLSFNIRLTKCRGCGIPSNLELSVKGSVLKDFGYGKLDKNSALTKFTVKKGANQ